MPGLIATSRTPWQHHHRVAWGKAASREHGHRLQDLCSRSTPARQQGRTVYHRVLKACAAKLADVYTDILNTSLAQAVVPLLLPVPKKSHRTCMTDFRRVALTSVAMKCLE